MRCDIHSSALIFTNELGEQAIQPRPDPNVCGTFPAYMFRFAKPLMDKNIKVKGVALRGDAREEIVYKVRRLLFMLIRVSVG